MRRRDEPAVDRHTRDPGLRALTGPALRRSVRRALRDSLKSNLLNRVDLERIERGYYEQLLDPGRRLDDLADVPDLRLRGSAAAPGRCPWKTRPWSCALTTSARWS